jgi:hypothetical protein
MIVLKWAMVGAMALAAVLVGGMSIAWQRACMHISRAVVGVSTSYFVERFTPKFVAQRTGWGTILYLATGVLAWLLFNWKIAIVVFGFTILIAVLSHLLYPRPDSEYYLRRVMQDLETWQRIHTDFGEHEKAAEAE